MRATLSVPPSGVPWVEPTVENSPAVLFPIPDPPDRAPGSGEWVRLMDDFGGVRAALLRRDAQGFRIVGDALTGRDPGELAAQLDAADRDWDAHPFPEFERPPGFPEPPPSDTSVRTYRFFDDRTRAPVRASVTSACRRRGFDAYGFDAAVLRWQVVRVRRDQG